MIHVPHPNEPPATVSSINFPPSPGQSSHHQRPHAIRPPYLPFRRISLPTPAFLLQRQSVTSVASFDSLPEEPNEAGTLPGNGTAPQQPSVTGMAGAFGRPYRPSLVTSLTPLTPSSSETNGVRRRSTESPRREQRGRHRTKGSEVSASASCGLASSNSKAREAREAKRQKIIQEFYDTEKTYVDGLDFIYHHFLLPIIVSLETSNPILDRKSLTNVFSNFIDIWNLHKSFFDALTDHLSPVLLTSSGVAPSSAPTTSAGSNSSPDPASQTSSPESTPHLSPVLLSHFPYLSLYTPFITAFPSILSTLSDLAVPPSFSSPNPTYSKTFAEFLSKRESDPRCGKLRFRDWMLTIVQRCPRYLLLLKDLRACSEPAGDGDGEDGGEYAKLGSVLDLVAKITNSLNTSLQTHAQTLSLVSLQRSTSHLPFPLITPGRTLLKRGPLHQLERSEQAREREFLLFSDCIVWLARSGDETDWVWGKVIRSSFASSSSCASSPVDDYPDSTRMYGLGSGNRSMNDVHLPVAPQINRRGSAGDATDVSRSAPSSPQRTRISMMRTHSPLPVPIPLAKRHSTASTLGSGSGSSGVDERWVYKGRLELVDVEVVVASEWGGEQRRFEVLSPESSFALYAATESDRDDWVSAIRQAKAQVLVSLNVTNPNSTLTSSASTNHVRRLLQALPFPPSDNRLGTVPESADATPGVQSRGKENAPDLYKGERRGKVEHWVPAIWIPDEKTKECMRCGQPFGWRRRRHHCRLCGRCVCASCSEKTFYIADLNAKDGSSKPARACNVCYETVFPVLEDLPLNLEGEQDDDVLDNKSHSKSRESSNSESNAKDTITSLSNFSAWMSMPSLPNSVADMTPQALMGLDFERGVEGMHSRTPSDHGSGEGRRVRVRRRSQNSRPISYMQVLEGFAEGGNPLGPASAPSPSAVSPLSSQDLEDNQQRVESTVRKRKRFSLPAIAMQPMNVTTRTVLAGGGDGLLPSSTSVVGMHDQAAVSGVGRNLVNRASRRFSLVLSGRNQSSLSINTSGGRGGEAVAIGMEGGSEVGSGREEAERSVVIGKLSELLKGSKARS